MSLKCVKEDGRILRLNHVAPEVSCKPPKSESVRVSTTSLDHGTAVTLGEWNECSFSDRDKGLKWYDFSIDSLSQSGMLSEMSFSQYSDNVLSSADGLDAIANNLNKTESAE